MQNNNILSSSKYIYILYIKILEFSDQILESFIHNDNKKIACNIRHLIYLINKFFIKKKKIFYYDFFYEMTKKAFERKKNKNNIYTDLFNDYKKKEKKLIELKYRFNKSEEKMCTFSPRINHINNKIKNKIFKISSKNDSFENKIKNPLFAYSYKRNNDLLYNDIDDIIKYETIDNNENNNKIILNFLNRSRINNIPKKDLYNVKYINNKNNNKNYFSFNNSRNSDFNIINNNNINNINNNLFRDLSGDKINKKRKEYYFFNMTNKKSTNQYNNNNYNKKEIDLHEPLIKNIDEKKYNTINATERKNINALNEPLTQIHNNNKIKYRSIIKPNRNEINNGLNQNYKNNEESKENNYNYYYTFRKEKVKYNSFNTTSKKKNKKIIPYNVKRFNKNKKNSIPISSRDNINSKNINKIYLYNYNNKICSQKKSAHDFNINNTKNTLSTINDTKVYTASNCSLNNPVTIKSKKESYSSNKKINKELLYSTNNKKTGKNFDLNKYEIAKECKMNLENKRDFKKLKNEKTMTLQSLSDSKMMELAENYINKGEDSFEVVDLKYLEFKKNLNLKKNKECKDITFG